MTELEETTQIPRPSEPSRLNLDENVREEETSEEDVAAVLDAEQQINLAQQQLSAAADQGVEYRHPSYLKYIFLILVALVIDIVDAADVTVIGIILSKIVSLGGTGIIYFTLWLTNGKVKRANDYSENLEAAVIHAQEEVAQYSRVAIKSYKAMKRIPGMGKLARRIPRTMGKIRRAARKNPLTKVLIGGAINLVPFLAILNLMVVWVILSFMDEKGVFKKTREASKEASEQFEIPQAA